MKVIVLLSFLTLLNQSFSYGAEIFTSKGEGIDRQKKYALDRAKRKAMENARKNCFYEEQLNVVSPWRTKYLGEKEIFVPGCSGARCGYFETEDRYISVHVYGAMAKFQCL